MTVSKTTGDHASKIYTRTGDKGKTSLIGGTRVSKSNERLDAYGTIDELNSVIGLLRSSLAGSGADSDSDSGSGSGFGMAAEFRDVDSFLAVVQSELFNVGSQLACEDPEMRPQLPSVNEDAILRFEQKMDALSATLKPLKNFILPGGALPASYAHLARTICRRAERHCVRLEELGGHVDEIPIRYVNRLSDYFFVLARFINATMKIDEPIWKS
jgi:cob(I)alamin adenosyltransferase